jgi:hypothetical protein
MRLGFWNRLALVIGVLFTLITPTALVLYLHADISESRNETFDACLAERMRLNEFTVDCLELSGIGSPINVGWTDWWQTLLGSAVFYVLLYLLIAAAVRVARWVWRGRSAQPLD